MKQQAGSLFVSVDAVLLHRRDIVANISDIRL